MRYSACLENQVAVTLLISVQLLSSRILLIALYININQPQVTFRHDHFKSLPSFAVDCRFVSCSIMHLAIMGSSTTPAKAFTSNSYGFSANGDFLNSLGKRVRELRSR